MEEHDDGLNFIRGLILALGMSSVLWGLIILIGYWILA